MLMLKQVADWIKEIDTELPDCIAVGTIDGNKEKYIGVYNDPNASGKQRVCLGGIAQTTYREKRVTLLVHWTNSAVQAEKKAAELYEKLCGRSGFQIGEVKIVYLDPGAAPVSVGRDVRGIYEYVINMKIIYERME